MITDAEIVGAALTAGFMLSTQYGQGELQMMPVSDTATLREFARAIYQLGRQHQRESDTALCRDAARVYLERSRYAKGEIFRADALARNATCAYLESAILANTGDK